MGSGNRLSKSLWLNMVKVVEKKFKIIKKFVILNHSMEENIRSCRKRVVEKI